MILVIKPEVEADAEHVNNLINKTSLIIPEVEADAELGFAELSVHVDVRHTPYLLQLLARQTTAHEEGLCTLVLALQEAALLHARKDAFVPWEEKRIINRH